MKEIGRREKTRQKPRKTVSENSPNRRKCVAKSAICAVTSEKSGILLTRLSTGVQCFGLVLSLLLDLTEHRYLADSDVTLLLDLVAIKPDVIEGTQRDGGGGVSGWTSNLRVVDSFVGDANRFDVHSYNTTRRRVTAASYARGGTAIRKMNDNKKKNAAKYRRLRFATYARLRTPQTLDDLLPTLNGSLAVRIRRQRKRYGALRRGERCGRVAKRRRIERSVPTGVDNINAAHTKLR